jgi:hypothetical protein
MSSSRASTVPSGSGESVVGGSEDGEGTFALQGFDQVGSGQGSGQGGEAAIRNGGFNDVLRGQQDGVDDMDHTVGGEDVGDDDLGIDDRNTLPYR